MESRVNTEVYRQRRERPDLLGERSPEGLRVTQISADAERPHSHIYMEARVFTPDSRRFVFQRFLDPADVDTRSSRREYLLCDIEDGYSFIQLTDEEGAIGPSVSPDGRFMYYFIDRTRAGGGWWAIKRVDLDSFQRETLARFDGPLPEAGRHLSLLYGTSSISSDGARLCMAGYLGDGRTHNAPWGLVVFDVGRAAVSLVFEGQSFCNIHHQYSRSKDPEESHDILLQDNHGCDVDELGDIVTLAGGKGADVHVIRDDGSDFRCYAFGRDGVETCQGHQAWRGEQMSVVASMAIESEERYPLLEATAVRAEPGTMHHGRLIPGATRNRISRSMEREDSCHFAFDPTGTKFVSDTFGYRGRHADCVIYVGVLPNEPEAALRTSYLLHPRSSFGHSQHTHPHPFQSPDGNVVLFNSDESGLPQIYAIEDFEYP